MTTFISYGKVAKHIDGELYLEGNFMGNFKSLKEAKEFLHGLRLSEEIREEKTEEKISAEQVALAMYESGFDKVTESLVTGFTEILEKNLFFPSDLVMNLRERYSDHSIGDKISYTMLDGSKVLIDIETNSRLNNLLGMQETKDLLLHMTKSSESFIGVIQELQEGL